MRRALVGAVFLALGVTLSACSSADGAPSEEERVEEAGTQGAGGLVLVLGDIDADPVKKSKKLQPLADYLAAALAPYGYAEGRVQIAPDLATMTAWVQAGAVDLYFDSPYPATLVADGAAGQFLLRSRRDGVAEYHSVIFARADSGLASIEDLRGKLLALDEPHSTSGYLMPLTHLAAQGLRAVEAGEAIMPPDAIWYAFSEDDDNTIEWVLAGLAAVGAMDNVTYGEISEETRRQLVVLAESEPLPRSVVVARNGLASAVVEAVRQTLLSLDDAPAGAPILEAIKSAQFDELPDGPEALLSSIHALTALLADD